MSSCQFLIESKVKGEKSDEGDFRATSRVGDDRGRVEELAILHGGTRDATRQKDGQPRRSVDVSLVLRR